MERIVRDPLSWSEAKIYSLFENVNIFVAKINISYTIWDDYLFRNTL